MVRNNNKFMKLSTTIISSLARYVFLIGMAYVLLFPVLYIISRAFRPDADLLNPSVIWIPTSLTLKNIIRASQILDYPQSISYTTFVVLLSTLLGMFSTAMAGYGLGRFRFRLKPVAVAGVVLTIIVPMQTYFLPLFFRFRYFDFFGIGKLISLISDWKGYIPLSNTFMPYFLTAILGIGLRSGLFILIFMQFFKNLPESLDSAARIDGCSEWKIFYKIMCPNIKPAMVTVFLFSLVWYWNDYFFSTIMMTKSPMLASKLGQLRSIISISLHSGGGDSGIADTVYIQSGVLLFILPPLLVYIFMQKQFTEGIERTGIVG